MAELKIELSSIELNVDETATIYTFDSPRTYLFQSTPELIEAGVSVQTYGVITVPTDATLTGQEIVEVEYVNKVYSALLSSIISAEEGDEISFSSLFITVEDLADVNITEVTNGQALVYDAISEKWVNGNVASGGGENYISVDEYSIFANSEYEEIDSLTLTLTHGDTYYECEITSEMALVGEPVGSETFKFIVNGQTYYSPLEIITDGYAIYGYPNDGELVGFVWNTVEHTYKYIQTEEATNATISCYVVEAYPTPVFEDAVSFMTYNVDFIDLIDETLTLSYIGGDSPYYYAELSKAVPIRNGDSFRVGKDGIWYYGTAIRNNTLIIPVLEDNITLYTDNGTTTYSQNNSAVTVELRVQKIENVNLTPQFEYAVQNAIMPIIDTTSNGVGYELNASYLDVITLIGAGKFPLVRINDQGVTLGIIGGYYSESGYYGVSANINGVVMTFEANTKTAKLVATTANDG